MSHGEYLTLWHYPDPCFTILFQKKLISHKVHKKNRYHLRLTFTRRPERFASRLCRDTQQFRCTLARPIVRERLVMMVMMQPKQERLRRWFPERCRRRWRQLWNRRRDATRPSDVSRGKKERGNRRCRWGRRAAHAPRTRRQIQRPIIAVVRRSEGALEARGLRPPAVARRRGGRHHWRGRAWRAWRRRQTALLRDIFCLI